MKTVFTGSEVPHIFATRSQSEGRNSGASLHFSGPTLRSYREPIAHFLPDGRLLMSSDSFSVTTSKHQSWTRHALRHLSPIDVPSLRQLVDNFSVQMRLDYIKARISDIKTAEDKIGRMRSKWKIRAARAEIGTHEAGAAIAWELAGMKGDWRANADKTIEKQRRADAKARYERSAGSLAYVVQHGAAERIARAEARIAAGHDDPSNGFFILDNLVSDLALADELGARRGDGALACATWADAVKLMGKPWAAAYRANVAALDAIAEPYRLRADAARVAYTEQQRRDNAEQLEKWLAGEGRAPRLTEVACRVIGDTVETTHGARVPLADALRVVKLAKACRDKSEPFARDTFATGPYKGVRIDTTGNVKIGCHDITWRAIADCAARFMPEALSA
jgi:hypothetical protein